jgi:hypothetical protein
VPTHPFLERLDDLVAMPRFFTEEPEDYEIHLTGLEHRAAAAAPARSTPLEAEATGAESGGEEVSQPPVISTFTHNCLPEGDQ